MVTTYIPSLFKRFRGFVMRNSVANRKKIRIFSFLDKTIHMKKVCICLACALEIRQYLQKMLIYSGRSCAYLFSRHIQIREKIDVHLFTEGETSKDMCAVFYK